MEWQLGMTELDRVKVFEHLMSRMGCHYTALPTEEVSHRVSEYEASIFEHCMSRTNYLRRVHGIIAKAEDAQQYRRPSCVPELTPRASDSSQVCTPRPVESSQNEPPCSHEERLAALRHLKHELTEWYTDESVMELAVEHEAEVYATARNREDYARAIARTLHLIGLRCEMDDVLKVPTDPSVF